MYADNRDSLSATELVSSFLMNDVHVSVVIGQVYLAWLTLRLDKFLNSSDAIILSTAGGDGLTNLSSMVGYGLLLEMTATESLQWLISSDFAESYAFALILSDRHDLLDCATRPGDYFNEGCQVIDIDNVLPHDQMQDYLYGMNSPLYEAFIYPYKKITPYLPKVGTNILNTDSQRLSLCSFCLTISIQMLILFPELYRV